MLYAQSLMLFFYHFLITIIVTLFQLAGRVIFLEFQGRSCIGICAALLFSNSPDNPANVYCSPNLDQAKIDYERLSHLLDSGVSMT